MQITSDLAEIYGIMAGDGNVTFRPDYRQYRIKLVFDKITDKLYLEKYVTPLFSKTFGIEGKTYVYPNANKMEYYFYSKPVVEALMKLGLPTHKMKGSINIPQEILEDTELSKSLIRGFFDCDGSIYSKYGHYAQVGLRCANTNFLLDLKKILINLGFSPSTNQVPDYVYIHRQKEVKKFFETVGSSNPKHVYRYNYWKKHNRVPKIRELIGKLEKENYTLPFFDR